MPLSWDLLDETGSRVVEEVVEDKDQGPSKEWGPYRWYHHPAKKNKLSWPVQGSQNSKLQGFDFIMGKKLIC